MKSVRFITFGCMALFFVSACGQKGPLYLPTTVNNSSIEAYTQNN